MGNKLPASRHAEQPATAHQKLLETIEHEVALFGTGEGEHRLDPRVADALAKVEREQFVPADLAARAYDNRPLPIGHGQTISQPLIVAVMTHLLHLGPDARVLEVGTGSGYQTAILAELAREVVTIEAVADLATAATAKLGAMGYDNVEFRTGDGAAGWPDAPRSTPSWSPQQRERPAGTDRSAGAGRPDGDPDWRRSAGPGPVPDREGPRRRRAPAAPLCGGLRAAIGAGER